MTLAEFSYMVHGYHQRQAEHWRRTRELMATLYNVNRGPEDAPVLGSDLFALPGDAPAAGVPALSPQQVEAEFARLAALDSDLF